MSEILAFTVLYAACLARDRETLPAVPEHSSSLRAGLHLHCARICEGRPLTVPRNTKPRSSPLLASLCRTRCRSSQAPRAQAPAPWQLNSPNHKIAHCNDRCNRARFSFRLHQVCPSRAAWTFIELLLIYPGVIRKQLSSVTFQVRGLPWQRNIRVHQLPEGALSTVELKATSVIRFVFFPSLQILISKGYKKVPLRIQPWQLIHPFLMLTTHDHSYTAWSIKTAPLRFTWLIYSQTWTPMISPPSQSS